MDLEYLQTLWQKDEGGNRYALDERALTELVQHEGNSFEKVLRHRDWFELIGGAVIGTFFIVAAIFILPGDQGTRWIDHWDYMLLGVGCFVIAVIFARLRLESRAFVKREGDTLLEALEKRRQSLTHRIRLLKTLAWWYIMPVAIPLGIVVVRSFQPEKRISYSIICGLSFAIVIYYNRWVAKRRLQPQLDSVNRLMEETR